MLTEWVDWRWTLFVNLTFTAVALTGAVTLLVAHTSERRPTLDIPGIVTVSASRKTDKLPPEANQR